MSKIIGIDLGTTNSGVAVMDLGIPSVIPDADGLRLTPSVVGLANPDAPLVGVPAQRQAAVHATDTIASVKRFMGRRGDEIEGEAMARTYTVIGKGDAPPADGLEHFLVEFEVFLLLFQNNPVSCQ